MWRFGVGETSGELTAFYAALPVMVVVLIRIDGISQLLVPLLVSGRRSVAGVTIAIAAAPILRTKAIVSCNFKRENLT